VQLLEDGVVIAFVQGHPDGSERQPAASGRHGRIIARRFESIGAASRPMDRSVNPGCIVPADEPRVRSDATITETCTDGTVIVVDANAGHGLDTAETHCNAVNPFGTICSLG
jgi:hypothetical protein